MTKISSTTSAESSQTRRAACLRLPDEIGVIAALAAMVIFIGVLRPDFLVPVKLLRLFGNTAFYGMIALAIVFLLAIQRDRSL